MEFSKRYAGNASADNPISHKTVSEARYGFFETNYGEGGTTVHYEREMKKSSELSDFYEENHRHSRINLFQYYANDLETLALAAKDGMREEARVIKEESEKFDALLQARAQANETCPIGIASQETYTDEEKALGFKPVQGTGTEAQLALLNNIQSLLHLADPKTAALEQTRPIIEAQGAIRRMSDLLRRLDAEYPEASSGRSAGTALQRGAENPITVASLKKELAQFERAVCDQSYIAYRFLEELTPEKLAKLEAKYANRPMTAQEAFAYRDNYVRDFSARVEGVCTLLNEQLIQPEIERQKSARGM